MQRVKLGLVCLSWLYLASAVSAQTAVDPTTDAGIASIQNVTGGGVLQGTYFDVRHVLGDGVGYQNSYSQVGAFTPFWLNEDSFLAPNARLTITNTTQIGVSAGGVARSYVNRLDRILGVYGYYDDDQNANNFRYSQFTVGAETLGERWDLRANGYFVTGTDNHFLSALGVGGNPFYAGNNIAFIGKQQRDGALSGGDAEIGAPVSAYAKWLRGYAGIYGYKTGTSETIGFRGRAEAMVSNDLTLGVTVSQDALYGTNVNGTLDFKFSGFQPTQYFPNLTTKQRMLNPVQRNWRIATRTYIQDVNINAINPATNKPYFVTFVNNNSPAPGNGTFEHPFNRLPNSAPGDIILVERGTSTITNPVLGSIALSDNQRLLGDGILSTVLLSAQYGSQSIFGTYNLPETSNSGRYPYVSSTGNIVTLANNNEVAGLYLLNAGGSAITNNTLGSNPGSKNFNLHHLEIGGNAGQGISLTNASGIGIINNINVGTFDRPNPFGLGNNAGGGIQISTGTDGLNLALQNVYMNANPTGSQAYGVSLTANNGYLNADLNTVFANGNGTGIRFSESSQLLNATMKFVRANGNTGAGIAVQGTGGAIQIQGDDVAAIGNTGDNLQIGSIAAPIVTSTVAVTLNNAYFTGSTGGSGIVFSQSGGVGTLNLMGDPVTGYGPVVTGNKIDGLSILSTNSAFMNANIQNGQFQNNGRDAFHVETGFASTVNLLVDPTNASFSGRDGLYYNLGQNSVFNATFLGDNLNNSGRSAVYGMLTNFATANLFFDNTTGANSAGNGFYVNATNNAVANLEVAHGTFANSGTVVGGSSAINIFSDNATVNMRTNLTLANNFDSQMTIGNIGNQSYGLTLNVQNNSVFNGAFQNGGNSDGTGQVGFSDSLVSAVNANILSGSTANLSLFNMVGDRTGWDGFVANVNNATLVANVTNGSFSNDGRHGVNFNVTNGGAMTANFDNTRINNNLGSGVNGVVNGVNSIANVNLMNLSTVNNNATSGIDFNVNAGVMNVGVTSSSISNNGAGGTIGSGVLGVVTNVGTANLDFQNATINNNLDNGVFVTTNTGGNVNARFGIGSVSGNGVNSPQPLHYNDGIRLVMDGSGSSSLQVVNGQSITGNGNDGIEILATNSTNFQGLIDTATIINNGVGLPVPFPFVRNKAGVEVTTETNSMVNLAVNGSTIGNIAPGGPQQIGFLSETNSGGRLSAAFSSTNLSNNAANALVSTVESSGAANIFLNSVTGDNSGSTGAVFNVTSGGQLNVVSAFSTSFSSSGGSGLFANVDGAASVANFDLDSIALSSNGFVFGGQGFNGVAANGASLNAVINNSNILNNANQGIAITAANLGTVANFHVGNSLVSFNGDQGLSINVTDQAQVNYRTVSSQYNNNGRNGVFDGVTVNATGNGPADSATALLLFAGSTVNSNTGNGFALNAANGGTLTTSINTMDISSNGGYGILGTATDTNTKFNLIMSGTNTLTGNTLGSIGPLVFNGINQAILDITGTFSNPTGDGVHVDLQNIVNAEVAIQGPGSINNSGGNGIFVNMNNVTNGSLLINGFTEINNSALDGIQANLTNVANGAVLIQGPTTISNSGNDAINLNLTGTNLVNNLAYGGGTLQVLTLNDNLATPLNNRLPIPVTLNLNQVGITPTNALLIDGITAAKSGNTGINIAATNTNIAANGSFITNNTVSTSLKGDGLHLNFNTVTADGLFIQNNSLTRNTQNGINLELFNSPINGVSIFNNVVSNNGTQAVLPGTLNFSFNNVIWTTFMNNNSTAGIEIASVTIDLTPIGQHWRPDLTPTPTGIPAGFYPFPPTDVTVGLSSVDGVAVTPGNYPVQGTDGTILPNGGVPIDSQSITLGFNQFTPGTQFHYQLAHGALSSVNNNLLDGTTLAGATGTVTLTDGTTASGVLTSSGLQITQAIAGSGASVAALGEDGIRFNLNNSSLSNLNVAGNTISANGTTGSGIGHGIEFTGATGSVVNSDITNAVFTANTITNNNGDGIRLVNPTTVSNLVTTVFTNNSITGNTGTGVNLSLVNPLQPVPQNLNASFASNTISSNAGGPGINIRLADNANMTGGFDRNTINSNGAQGVNFNMGTNGAVTSNFTNNIINGNTAEGIRIALNTGGAYNGAAFYGNTIGTTASPNGSVGVRLTVPDLASFNWNLGDSTQAANSIVGNSGAGVGILMSGASTGTLNVANSSFNNTRVGADANFTGQGLAVIQQGSSTLTGSIQSSTFNNNAGNGALFSVTGNTLATFAQLNSFTVGGGTTALGNTFNSNGGNGLEFVRTAYGQINNVLVQNSVMNSNTLNGLVIRAENQDSTDTYTVNNNVVSSNGLNGLLLDERADAKIDINMTQNSFTQNQANGIQIVEQVNAATDLRKVSGTWTLNTITNNQGDGILISGAVGGLLIGDLSNSNLGNVISLNRRNGVEVTGPTDFNGLTIGSNAIQGNGTLANLGTANENAGILMNVRPFSNIAVVNNLITNNLGDGVQYQLSKGFSGFFTQLAVTGNTITDNSGRGVNVINRASNFLQADISGNFISANRLEGIYIVNTSSGNQDVWSSGTAPLLADADVFERPTMQLRVVGNEVLGNGTGSNLAGTGLVIRVGTSNGGRGVTDTGGFVSTGVSSAIITQGVDASTFFNATNPFSSNVTRGGVIAQVDNNTLGGNFGNDILFHSFVSTVAPIVTAGTWDNTQFNPTAYQSDPLSRFDLYFRGNTTDPGSIDTVGSSLGGFGSRNPALVAFYNNAEGVFKSRLNTIAAPNIPGPFNSATRARNATRQAARLPGYDAPASAFGAAYLYPGMGASTWRVSVDSQNVFARDTSPFTNNGDPILGTFGNANGDFLGGIGNNGELPFGYGTFP